MVRVVPQLMAAAWLDAFAALEFELASAAAVHTRAATTIARTKPILGLPFIAFSFMFV
jgi:hypothetical protein